MGYYLPGPAGVPSPGVAPDGLKGQYLRKASDLDFDTEWVDVVIPEGGGGGGGGTGPGAPALVRRIDASATTTIYNGRAPAGTAEGATGWVVTRATFSALGALIPPIRAASGAWSARASLTYS